VRGLRTASMGARIGVALLVGALVPLGVLGALFFWQQSDHERDDALSTLTAIANLQEARVEEFERARLREVRALANRTEVRTELSRTSDGIAMDLASLLRVLLDTNQLTPGVLAASATDREGVVVASTRPDEVGTQLPAARALRLGDPSAAVFHVVDPDAADQATDGRPGPPRMVVAVPVALGGRPVGTVALEITIEPLVDLATNHEGLGDTGEALLGTRTPAGDARYLTPLRFDDDSQFSRTVPSSATEVPMTVALRGQAGLLEDAVDYRGEPVLAATRHLEDSGLGLVVKIDRAEAYAPVGDLLRLLVLGVVLAALVAGCLAWAIGRRLGRPITQVQQVATRIGRGDHAARADTSAPGELGALAASLNDMAAEISSAHEHLEAQVVLRTQELEAKIRELEHRNDELDAFSSAVAHDLKSPLTVIKGAVETIRTGRVDQDRARVLLEASASAAERMRALIDDLLVLARTGTAELLRDDVSLQHVATEAVTILDLGDVVTIQPLPIVEGDRALLQQALQNLLDNAARYAGDPPRIVVSAVDLDQDTVALAVDDDGRGIPPDERATVFRPFTRGSSSAGSSGTGVGLAIVARIAERHGGEAIATESPLGGARMLLTLPRERIIVPAAEVTPV
jgi:signal transduction histidine kinase